MMVGKRSEERRGSYSMEVFSLLVLMKSASSGTLSCGSLAAIGFDPDWRISDGTTCRPIRESSFMSSTL